MKKPLASRIFGLAVLYLAVFVVLVLMQFSNKGNFTLTTGSMTIRGRYSQAPSAASQYSYGEKNELDWLGVTGGIKIFYGGVEFNLSQDNGKGMVLTGIDGASTQSSPDFMVIDEDTARFSLPDGTTLVFSSFNSEKGSGLQISAELAEDTFEAAIPVVHRRSTLVHDNDQLGVLYNGEHYFFGRSSQELEEGKLVLSRGSVVSYRPRGKQRIFDPDDYIIAEAKNIENVIEGWRNSNFNYWAQNAAVLQNEDDVTAYCAEALPHGNYTAAVASISREFTNSARHTYRSSGFIGGMTTAYRTFASDEREKINSITNQLREKSLDVLKEEHILDYLLTRNNTAIANDTLDLIRNTEPEMISLEYCPGLLEASADFIRWRLPEANFISRFIEHILLILSENIHHDIENNLVYVSHNEDSNDVNDPAYNLRLGKALLNWAQPAENTAWADISRSLIFSALSKGDAGNLYRILNPAEYYPRASWLADNGIWAWTVSPSVSASYIEGNLNIAFSFPQNMAHYVIISGVRPFIKIQVHGTDWRSDSQFERYDSSGWVYYAQDQILVVKLRHRANVENFRVFYRVEEPPVVEPPAVIEERPANTDNYPTGVSFDL